MIDRRRFLGLGGGLAAGLVLPAAALGVGQAEQGPHLLAAACKDRKGRFAALLFEAETGREVAGVVLPARGHDIALRPRGDDGGGSKGGRELVAFARRPGNFAVVFGEGREPLWFTSRADRCFYGHGVFSPDGRLLYTTENDFEAGRGVIGVRDATDGYKQIGELAAGGIGTHELALLSDGRTLVVANGGITTHPSTPRLELNLATMEPSLSYVDTRTGDVLEQHPLPREVHQLSIRHLTVGKGDTVIFGCQFRGPRWETQAIVGRHRRGKAIELLPLPGEVLRDMRNYVASLATDRSGETAVIAAPRGGVAVVLDVASGRYLGRYAMANVFGIAARSSGDGKRDGFLLTSGDGVLASGEPLSNGGGMKVHAQELVRAWDNHLLAVG